MSLISASALAKSYGHFDLFSGISFDLPHRARFAIVGPNGVGKTTLLRILAGEESPSEGNVQRAKSLTIGYLPQEAGFQATHTLWEECLAAVAELRAQESQLAALEAELARAPHDEDLLEHYGKLQAAFEYAGGYTYETRIRQVLSGLGFSAADYDLRLPQLSGGQRTRALLARLLLAYPDLLILDEPTNHLDIAAVEWLESALREWQGAALIVSHDRYFLDQVAEHIWEMRPGGFETYRGNYSHYLRQREERWAKRQELAEREVARMEKELAYIRINIAGQNVAQAKGRLARLSREIAAIEILGFDAVRGRNWGQLGIDSVTFRVEEASQRLHALRVPKDRLPVLHLKMRAPERSGNIVLRADDLEIGYPTKTLFRVEHLELHRQDCAALIGPNGAGKTTFLRAILGQHPPLGGEVNLGASLKVGYFAQAHEGLNPNLTLVEEIDRLSTGLLEKDIRAYLGRFLFSGDDQYKKVSVLSGGERGRLALAKLTLSDANFLLLDEPSNHLDVPSQEVLQGVLAEFNGAILMVSHDRYLIDALATQIWVIEPEEKTLRVFKGTYSEYHAAQEAAQAASIRPLDNDSPPADARPQTLSKYEQKRRQERLALAEARIAELEARLAAIAARLAEPPADPEEVRRLSEEYAVVEKELGEAMREWEGMLSSTIDGAM